MVCRKGEATSTSIVYTCDLCSFQSEDSGEAAFHRLKMNEGVRNKQWKHEIIPIVLTERLPESNGK